VGNILPVELQHVADGEAGERAGIGRRIVEDHQRGIVVGDIGRGRRRDLQRAAIADQDGAGTAESCRADIDIAAADRDAAAVGEAGDIHEEIAARDVDLAGVDDRVVGEAGEVVVAAALLDGEAAAQRQRQAGIGWVVDGEVTLAGAAEVQRRVVQRLAVIHIEAAVARRHVDEAGGAPRGRLHRQAAADKEVCVVGERQRP
jgi:hypothetical protein